jgi:hypothetical protein
VGSSCFDAPFRCVIIDFNSADADPYWGPKERPCQTQLDLSRERYERTNTRLASKALDFGKDELCLGHDNAPVELNSSRLLVLVEDIVDPRRTIVVIVV